MKLNPTAIYVYGLCDVFYDSYYIKGLQDYFGLPVRFNIDKFPRFRDGTFAVILETPAKAFKIIIDSRDANTILEEELFWCDRYGKVNYNLDAIPAVAGEKIHPIGPSFGIKIWNLPQTLTKAFVHLMRFRNVIGNKRNYVANYWRQYKRMRLEAYRPKKSKRDYIFFMGSIWKKEAATNHFRSLFIRACSENPSLQFEGGFAPRKDGNNYGFDALVTENRYPIKIYMDKLHLSAIAFNTPAVLSCHGWKLAEFLAMGKAIVSTPHINVLPAPLTEGVQMVYVSENELQSYTEKIGLLTASDIERLPMQEAARAYFDDYLEPAKVIERLYRALSEKD